MPLLIVCIHGGVNVNTVRTTVLRVKRDEMPKNAKTKTVKLMPLDSCVSESEGPLGDSREFDRTLLPACP